MKLIKYIFSISLFVLVATPARSSDYDKYLKPENSVKILSISPSNKKPLESGKTVSFDLEIQYKLGSAEAAKILMHVQRSDSHKPLLSDFDVVLKGEGKIHMSKDVLIPKTKAIEVFISLLPEGMNTTGLVDSRFYKVATNN